MKPPLSRGNKRSRDGEVSSPYPIDQEKSALEFPNLQFPSGFNLLVIINYQLSINEPFFLLASSFFLTSTICNKHLLNWYKPLTKFLIKPIQDKQSTILSPLFPIPYSLTSATSLFYSSFFLLTFNNSSSMSDTI